MENVDMVYGTPLVFANHILQQEVKDEKCPAPKVKMETKDRDLEDNTKSQLFPGIDLAKYEGESKYNNLKRDGDDETDSKLKWESSVRKIEMKDRDLENNTKSQLFPGIHIAKYENESEYCNLKRDRNEETDSKFNSESNDRKLAIAPVVLLVDFKRLNKTSIVPKVKVKSKMNEREEIAYSLLSSNRCTRLESDPNVNLDFNEVETYSCTTCDFETRYKESLRNHAITHKPDRPFHCSMCQYKSKRKDDLLRHIETHSTEYLYKCPLCNYKSNRKRNLKVHMLIHDNPNRFKCLICQKVFSQKGNLSSHTKDIHQMSGTGIMFKCEFCNFKRFKKSIVNYHMKTIHAKVKEFKCTICSYCTARKSDLPRHMMVHTGIKPFKCDLCSYSTTNQGTLNNHKRDHTNERPFKCVLCDASFKVKGTLNEHMLKHQEHKIQCPNCNYTTVYIKHMKSHIRIVHTNVKPYKCPDCNYAGKTSSGLKQHMKFHSGEFLKCEICDYKTPHLLNMKSHMHTHKGVRPFKCSACDYAGRSKSHLKRHFEKSHDENGYGMKKERKTKEANFPCNVCGFNATLYGYLKNHLEKKHNNSGLE